MFEIDWFFNYYFLLASMHTVEMLVSTVIYE
jgi:hypothetical protein